MHVSSAGNNGVYANTTQASGQWGFYTPDKIYGSNVTLESISLLAQVAGPDGLVPGDLVAVAGVADPLPGSTVHIPLVRLAGGAFNGVVGVVESRMAFTPRPARPQGDTAAGGATAETPGIRSVDGPAQAGDYVSLTVLGAAQVKMNSDTAVEAGQRLTAAAAGAVRPLGTIKVLMADGSGTADISENAPVIGMALEGHTPGKDLIWVLVNPR